MTTTAALDLTLPNLNRVSQGKVRDIYEVDGDKLLLVTTDRISAFDVILNDLIPGKGAVLNQVTNIWMDKFSDIVPNHLTEDRAEDVLYAINVSPEVFEHYNLRSVVAKKLTPLPIEAIVRGYIIGSGWKDYQSTGKVCGHELPAGLQKAEKLPEAIFTPSTKADVGDHDENITYDAMVDLVGETVASQVKNISLDIYNQAHDLLLEKGIILADTKLEFGLDAAGVVHLIDEVLTPDSSRFWPADSYEVGISPVSYDKQYVRDYLDYIGWTGEGNIPSLPSEVILKTSSKYQEAFKIVQSL